MENRIDFILKPSTIENLQAYSEMLDKEISTVIEEALDAYFAETQKRLLEKNIADENAMTNLDYDEFWDGVEL
jgi:hypothetical protein